MLAARPRRVFCTEYPPRVWTPITIKDLTERLELNDKMNFNHVNQCTILISYSVTNFGPK